MDYIFGVLFVIGEIALYVYLLVALISSGSNGMSNENSKKITHASIKNAMKFVNVKIFL